MKIKTIRLNLIIVYLFNIFLLMKMNRAFSGSTQEGGIWNIIQIIYVCVGILFFLKYFKIIAMNKVIVYITLYSICAFFISLITLKNFSLSMLFSLLKTLYPGATLIAFYIVGKKLDPIRDLKSIKIFFMVSATILIVALGRHMYSGGWRASEVGAVADVYYLLGLLPLLLMITDFRKWLFPILATGIAILLSQKRGGLIAFLLVVIILYGNHLFQTRNLNTLLKTIIGCACLLLIGYFLFSYLDTNFNLNVMERLERLSEDGGSGRDIRWAYTWKEIRNSNFINFIFGHGNYSAVSNLGVMVHNDFLQIWYEYGIITIIFYAGFFVQMFIVFLKMFKANYKNSLLFFCSIIISLILANVSFYAVDATYITSGCFVQGILLADFEFFLQRKGELLNGTN